MSVEKGRKVKGLVMGPEISTEHVLEREGAFFSETPGYRVYDPADNITAQVHWRGEDEFRCGAWECGVDYPEHGAPFSQCNHVDAVERWRQEHGLHIDPENGVREDG